MKIVLYSTKCPRCKVLEQKLKKKGLEYIEENDVQEMIAMGFKSAPLLSVDGAKPMEFAQAVQWINAQEDQSGEH